MVTAKHSRQGVRALDSPDANPAASMLPLHMHCAGKPWLYAEPPSASCLLLIHIQKQADNPRHTPPEPVPECGQGVVGDVVVGGNAPQVSGLQPTSLAVIAHLQGVGGGRAWDRGELRAC